MGVMGIEQLYPALLFNQNEQRQTKSERQIGILFRAHP